MDASALVLAFANCLHRSLCLGVAEAKAYRLVLTASDTFKNSSVLAGAANALSVGVWHSVVLIERFGHCPVLVGALASSKGRTCRAYQLELVHRICRQLVLFSLYHEQVSG